MVDGEGLLWFVFMFLLMIDAISCGRSILDPTLNWFNIVVKKKKDTEGQRCGGDCVGNPNPVSDGEKESNFGAVVAKVGPWIEQTSQGFGAGLRRNDSERLIGWCNYVTAGVLSAPKIEFTANSITQMAHANPKTFIAVVMLPNRSGDLRTPTKCLVIVSCFPFSIVFQFFPVQVLWFWSGIFLSCSSQHLTPTHHQVGEEGGRR